MRGCLFNTLCKRIKFWASQSEPNRGLIEYVLHNRVDCATSHWPVFTADPKKERCRLTGERNRCIAKLAPVAGQLDHQLIRCQRYPELFAFAQDFEPPALFALFVPSAEESTHA